MVEVNGPAVVTVTVPLGELTVLPPEIVAVTPAAPGVTGPAVTVVIGKEAVPNQVTPNGVLPAIVPPDETTLAVAGVTAQEGYVTPTVALEVSAAPPPAGVQLRVNTSGDVRFKVYIVVGSVVGAAPVEDACVVFQAE